MSWIFNALAHVSLRLLRRLSNIVTLLNLSGMVALAIGVVLMDYDWVCILGGWGNQRVKLFTHLIIYGMSRVVC